MDKPLDALEFLAAPGKYAAAGVCLLFGDEAFLKRQVVVELRRQVLGGDEGDFSFTELSGETATLRDVRDELSTLAMFGSGRRLVVVDEADSFVSRHRSELEDLVARPPASAVLVLAVGSLPSNTRLYKLAVAQALAVECKCPPPARLQKWLVQWARQRHGAKLEPAAAESLRETCEPELGLLDQELAKLALLAGSDGAITPELVRDAVGGWRGKTTWDMLDAAVAGDAREALTQLDHLLLSGETPVGLLAQVSATLRRFAAAARRIEQAETARRRTNLREALEQVGVRPFALAKTEGQLRQVGRVRAKRLYRQLLEADLALKGSSSAPARARLVLEGLIARLSSAAAPPR